MNKKISIIIPVFNTQDYLKRCLESIINQSYKNHEIILINDGSTDNSKSIINKYCEKYNNIKSIEISTNSGVGNARNIGIANSTGFFVGFVDSDDWIDVNMYSKMVKAMNKNDTDIAICGVRDEYDNFSSSQLRYNYDEENVIAGSYALNLLCRTHNTDNLLTPMVCSKLYKMSFILDNKLQFLYNSYYEDDVFTFATFSCVSKIAIVPNVFYHYYQRPTSITHTFSKKHIDDLINAFLIIKGGIPEKHNLHHISFFEKCAKSMLNILFESKLSVIEQKEYLKYFTQNIRKVYSNSDLIDYIDISRIKKFLYL
jgi:glycosyltransferase involved in cell wall biosynthesis